MATHNTPSGQREVPRQSTSSGCWWQFLVIAAVVALVWVALAPSMSNPFAPSGSSSQEQATERSVNNSNDSSESDEEAVAEAENLCNGIELSRALGNSRSFPMILQVEWKGSGKGNFVRSEPGIPAGDVPGQFDTTELALLKPKAAFVVVAEPYCDDDGLWLPVAFAASDELVRLDSSVPDGDLVTGWMLEGDEDRSYVYKPLQPNRDDSDWIALTEHLPNYSSRSSWGGDGYDG